MYRDHTKVIKIGNRVIGGGNPVLIQSMTNTKTEDVEATVAQILSLEKAGCDIIRCAVPDMEAARALSRIRKQIHIPLVADIHFDYRLAIAAMENGADKIRINPGNIGSKERIKAVVDTAKERNIPIRVGVNSGSLEKELVEKYHGVTAEGLVESALDKVHIIEEMGYDNLVISIKSSDVLMCAKAHELIAKQTQYPLHVGITEVSDNYGIRVVALEEKTEIIAGMKEAVMIALGMAIGCFVISMGVVIFIASKLSRPLTVLKDQMENTGIENMDAELVVPNTDDEVQAVGIAYQNLMHRLNESIVKERRMSLLQLQAQFDTLQAQVNPHFLYNVLNVISSRGIMDGDEEICEICGCLAAMLRYSTNTKERYATVEKELEYLERYIFLLKSRYEHRLEVEVDCEESVKQEQLPKIVLQQLVENSIQHGYNNSKNIMKIYVHGWRDETGWYFEVRDNGQGTTEEVREELNEKMRKIREKIMSRGSSIEFEIGGMGLANTYARMFLVYNGRAVFRIRNLEEGLSVIIGVSEKEDEADVSGDGC